MADFDENQIREFVAKWFSGDPKQDERRDLFLRELQTDESEGLLELARVPLLLALLCLSFEETQKLSSRRVELYEEALDALLEKWDASRNIKRDEIYRELSLRRKEQMLALVAAETFDRAEYFIPENTLTGSFETFLSHVPNAPVDVDGKVILRAIVEQHGLFVEQARKIYSFAHLSLHEFFTARHLVENEARGSLPRLIDHYADPRYHEVFLMTAAQLPAESEFFTLFIERLAADAQRRPAVAALLRQVARKAATASGEALHAAAARSNYLFLALALYHSFNLDQARARAINVDLSRALGLVLELDGYLDLALLLSFELGGALDDAHALDRALGLALDDALAHMLADSPHRQLARDIALVNTRLMAFMVFLLRRRDPDDEKAEQYFAAAQKMLTTAYTLDKAMGDVTTETRTANPAGHVLPSGSHDAKEAGMEDQVAIQDNSLKAYGLAFPELEAEDWEEVSRYLAGNDLLLECLEQAAVANRQAIKNRLLLLPDA